MQARITPEAAFHSSDLGEFLLPCDVVRQASKPDAGCVGSTEAPATPQRSWVLGSRRTGTQRACHGDRGLSEPLKQAQALTGGREPPRVSRTKVPDVPSKPSPRIEAAIALLDPRPGEYLLEIGCGSGQAIEAALARQPAARIVAIDRSDKAVARARVVNATTIATGNVEVLSGDIEQASVSPGMFDRVFALRVNSFWTRPGVALPHVAASLRPDGALWIVYDGPSAKVVDPILKSLEAFGMRDVRTAASPGAFAIVATRPA